MGNRPGGILDVDLIDPSAIRRSWGFRADVYDRLSGEKLLQQYGAAWSVDPGEPTDDPPGSEGFLLSFTEDPPRFAVRIRRNGNAARNRCGL